MILQTKVKNNQNGRVLRWTSNNGTYIEAGATMILEGAYPTACINPSAKKQFAAEIASEAIDVCILTDLPIQTLTKKQAKKAEPVAEDPKPTHKSNLEEAIKKSHEEVKNPTAEEISEAASRIGEQPFAEGRLDTFKPAVDTIVLGEEAPDGPSETVVLGEDPFQRILAEHEASEKAKQAAKNSTATKEKTPPKAKATRGRPKNTAKKADVK